MIPGVLKKKRVSNSPKAGEPNNTASGKATGNQIYKGTGFSRTIFNSANEGGKYRKGNSSRFSGKFNGMAQSVIQLDLGDPEMSFIKIESNLSRRHTRVS